MDFLLLLLQEVMLLRLLFVQVLQALKLRLDNPY
jgi:hypothetical protein